MIACKGFFLFTKNGEFGILLLFHSPILLMLLLFLFFFISNEKIFF